jgi:hypothetical protein
VYLVGDEIQLGFVVICLKKSIYAYYQSKGYHESKQLFARLLVINKLVITINLLFNFLFEFLML